MDPAKLLVVNALAQITFSAWFGGWVLYRLHVAGRRNGARDLIAAHLDWIVLGLVQVAVAHAIDVLSIESSSIPAVMIAIAGWLNPVPYLARGAGVNAFVFGGGAGQRVLAAISAVSALILTCGLTWTLVAIAL